MDLEIDEIHEFLKKLNALSDYSKEWSYVKARKDQMDEFERKINPGEHYFRQGQYGCGMNAKLSVRSMSKFIGLLFIGNRKLQKIGGKFYEIEFQKLRDTANLL